MSAQNAMSGIPRLLNGLFPALLDALEPHTSTIITTGLQKPRLTNQLHTAHRHIVLPNKLWSVASTCGICHIDQLSSPRPDHVFLGNIGFVGRIAVPYSLLVHDLSFLIEPRLFLSRRRLWHIAVRARHLIQRASHLFAVSFKTKQDILSLFPDIPSSRIKVIPLGLSPLPTDDDLPDIFKNKKIVLALGADDPRKNIACVKQAVYMLRQENQYKDLILVTTGVPTPVSESWIYTLSCPNDTLLGTLMRHAAAVCYPSWYEGFGLVLHEAAFFGTPCISSTAGALPETAPQGTIFVPPMKPHLWTEALKITLQNPLKHQTSTQSKTWTDAAHIIAQRILT